MFIEEHTLFMRKLEGRIEGGGGRGGEKQKGRAKAEERERGGIGQVRGEGQGWSSRHVVPSQLMSKPQSECHTC